MDVELRIAFTDADEKKVVALSRVIIRALRKWRPSAKDFVVKVAGKDIGISIVSER